MRKTLCLDFDGTLNNFSDAWCVWLKNNILELQPMLGVPERIITSKDMINYNWPSQTFGPKANDFFKKDPLKTYREWIKPIPMAFEFIRWCQTCNLFSKVYILTHANEAQTKEAKTEFIAKHFGNIKVDFFDTIEDKYKHLDNCILLDDYPLHSIMNAATNGNHSITFNYCNEYGWADLKDYWDLIWKEKPNLKHLHVARDYKEVIDILKEISK